MASLAIESGRNHDIYTSTSKLHKVSIRDMVNMTLKNNDVFGIEGYNIPRHEPISKGRINGFSKGKFKNFAEEEAHMVRANPGPGEYKVSPKWGMPEKKVNPTKKNTYIE
jgi:hypothetical protein